MTSKGERWVLAFDASCGRCRETARTLEHASRATIDILPLNHPDVRRWRAASRRRTPWTPTLIRVDDPAETWTGASMAVRLARVLGVRASARTLLALGAPRTRAPRVLRLAAGLAVLGSILLARRGPDTGGYSDDDPRGWVAANRDRLPDRYEQVIAHALPYRRAIFAELPPATRGRLWVEHLTHQRSRATTVEQNDALNAVIDFARAGLSPGHTDTTELSRLTANMITAFGEDEARAILTVLGPESPVVHRQLDCSCANYDSWCGEGLRCTNWPTSCTEVEWGCGTLWSWRCDGICQ